MTHTVATEPGTEPGVEASAHDGSPTRTSPSHPDGPAPVRRPERIALLVGAVALGVAVIATRAGVFTPDTRPDLYQQPGRFLTQSLQAWVGGSSGLGQANFNAGAAPVAVVVWVIRALGAPPWLAVRIWRLLILFLGAWGIRRYLSVLLGRHLTASARLFATAFWVANPYVVVAGSTTPILLPYALLPWTLLAFVHATRQPRSWRWPAVFALAFFAQTGLNAGVVPFFQLIALPAHVAHARWVEGRSWRDLTRVVWRCGALSVLVSLYWLLPSFLASSTGAGIAGSTENPRDVARTSSYSETARLLGNWPLYGRSGDRLFLGDYTTYLTNPFVVVASFLTPVAVGLSLWLARARERLLAIVLLACGLPVMVGLFPPDRPYAAGRFLFKIFDQVPASLAFRTTNKVGAVVVLAETIALVLGIRTFQARSRARRVRRTTRRWAAVLVVVLLAGGSAPLWNGGLYPLGYRIPKRWVAATQALDRHDTDQRVLVIPGGTGGNYRWGMRSPDDLFPSLLTRPVAVRNTVVGRGDPASNMMSAFDSALAEGSLPPDALSTVARYLGASDVLVRNDLLVEEITGPRPAAVVAAADADPGLVRTGHHGQRGADTIPNHSGPATKATTAEDPDDAKLFPIMTYEVRRDTPVVRAAAASGQVLVDGDGDAADTLSQAGILDGTQPLRELGDLDETSFAQAVRDGGRIVLTDTNRRRAWDSNRIGHATTSTLSATADIDAGNGTTVTRWPDEPDKQTVADFEGATSIGADRPGFGVFPFGRPSNAFDGDPNTPWLTGGFHTAAGTRIWVDLPTERTIHSITIKSLKGGPSSISAVDVAVGDKVIRQALPSDGSTVDIPLRPTKTRRVQLTIVGQTKGENPVGLADVGIDDLSFREVARLPETFTNLVTGSDVATRRLVADAPLDIVMVRAKGAPAGTGDDEEFQLDRDFDLPAPRVLTFAAELQSGAADFDALRLALNGNRPCFEVGELDGNSLRAKVVSTTAQIAAGRVLLKGCDPMILQSGTHSLRTVPNWRLDRIHFASPGQPSSKARSGGPPGDSTRRPIPVATDRSLKITSRSATTVDMEIGASKDGARLLRLGEAWDPRWTLKVDGKDAGEPIVVDGYATGWRIDGKAHHLEAGFGPQFAVESTFAMSLIGVVGVVGVIVLPPPPEAVVRRFRRRRHRRSGRSAGAA